MAALWLSKDRFAAKRLRGVADALDPAKRAVIEDKSAFRSLLTVAPFNIPNELIDFVALNTSPQLREFNYRSKRIVFTRDMVRKVFGFRCGDKKVELLKKSAAHELRDVYTSPKGRPDIATCIQVLQSCDVTDEDSILRSWDLLCLATVVDPGSGNNISMEYIASMLDPTKTHEYAWDELVLQLAMMEVTKIQKQYAKPVPIGGVPMFWISGPFALLGIVYMDHLDFPPNEHAINYSLPRACSVTTEDFEFTCANDLDRKILNNSTIFGRRPFRELAATPYGNAIEQPPQPSAEQVQEVEVNPSASLNEWLCFPSSDNLEIPARFKHLYDKHKEIFASDVDASLKTFGAGLKTMQAHRMAALLVDVEASLLVDGDGANVSFPTSDVPEDDQNKSHGAGEEEDEGVDDANMGADFVEPAPNVVAEALDSELVAKKVAESRLTNPASDQVAEGSDSEPATNRYELVARTISPDVPQPAVVMDYLTNAGDVGDQLVVNSPTRSMWQPSPRKDISDEAWNRAPDAPSMELFTEDSQEHAWLSVLNDKVDDSCSGGKPSSPIPIKDASMDLMTKGVASSNVGGSDKDHPTDTTNKDSEKTGGNDVVVAETSLVEAPSTEANSDEAAVPPSDPGTPVQLVTSEEDAAIGASTGAETREKKNRFKRACKTELVPPKMKKIKVSQEHIHVYDKYIFHGRKLKRKGKTAIPKPFIKIGRSYCTYKPFYASLRPRQCLDSEVMDVWIEKFNHDAKVLCEKNVRVKKKYAFSMLMTGQLAVDPALFKPSTCMKEFKIACSKFRILRDDLLYLPIVKDEHWIVCCFNIIHKQYHVFDSMMMEGSKSQLEVAANNVFSNFVRTANESGLSNSVDFGTFTRFTPVHPQQQTNFDCGFFSILIMENFNGKTVAEFTNECIPDFRKLLAASLIHGADNEDALEKLLEEELQFS